MMTPITSAFKRLELIHQQFASLAIGDDDMATQITKQMDELIGEMVRLPVESIDDLALMTYAATWGGDQGAFDGFSARIVEMVGHAGSRAFLHARAEVAGAKQASAEAEIMSDLAGMDPVTRGRAVQALQQHLSGGAA